MIRLGEKVDGLHAREPVTEADERPCIAGERRRIARYVEDALRSEGGERRQNAGGAGTWGVENDRGAATGPHVAQGGCDGRVTNPRPIEPVGGGIGPCGGNRRSVPLDS